MEKLLFYPLDITYKIENNIPVIHIFSKLPDGRHVCILDDSFKPYFWIIPKYEMLNEVKIKLLKLEASKDNQIIKVSNIETYDKNFLGNTVVALKVFVNLPSDVPIIKDIVKKWDIIGSVNEYDILFVRRYLIDKKIIPLSLTEATGEFIPHGLRVQAFKAAEVKPSTEDSINELKVISYDIETYNPMGKAILPEKHPIVMISLYSEELKKVITWKRFKTDLDYIEFVNSEAELINRFVQLIKFHNPDIIVGYYSDGFDLPYIKSRAELLKVKLDLGWDNSEVEIEKGMTNKAQITGITHIDIFRYISKILGKTLEAESLTLNKVALELLGEGKYETNIQDLAKVWDKNPEDLEVFCKYNIQDSILTFRLMQKMLPNISEMVKIVGLPLYDINRIGYSQLVEWYLLRRSTEFNEINPNKPDYSQVDFRRQRTFAGGFVYEPEPGLYSDIVVFDFRSLYPSIISSHNISPSTVNCDCCEHIAQPTPLEKNTTNTTWFCQKKKGFIPSVIEEIITRRSRIKDIMINTENNPFLEARSNSLKLLANSFYGYLGFPYARWYSLEAAESVTAWGRFYIKKVISRASQLGFKVIYSDTDSIFLTLEGHTKKDAMNFCETTNIELPGVMELEYEGYYPCGIFVFAKIRELGAKKRYALLSEKGLIKIRGFEAIRKNSSIIAKEVQENVLAIILKEKNPVKALEYVKGVIKQLKTKKIPLEKVIINTQLQKKVESYESISPHVAVAQRMKSLGLDIHPGSNIRFVITEDRSSFNSKERLRDKAKLPDEINDTDYDSDYYVKNQVIPSIERIFNVLGFTKDDLLDNKEQSKLASFF